MYHEITINTNIVKDPNLGLKCAFYLGILQKEGLSIDTPTIITKTQLNKFTNDSYNALNRNLNKLIREKIIEVKRVQGNKNKYFQLKEI